MIVIDSSTGTLCKILPDFPDKAQVSPRLVGRYGGKLEGRRTRFEQAYLRMKCVAW